MFLFFQTTSFRSHQTVIFVDISTTFLKPKIDRPESIYNLGNIQIRTLIYSLNGIPFW